MLPTLEELRVHIDAIDTELLALLSRRASLAQGVGEIKKREGSAFFRPDRVSKVIEQIQQANAGPLKDAHLAAIWREIMSSCLSLEAAVRVAYLGPAGTFSEQAAMEFFGSAIEPVACSSFDEVFHAAASGSADYGVVAVENSTEGVVSRSLDLLLTSPLHIVGEVSLLIRHSLLRATGEVHGIEAVYAHPQALAQCQGWLAAHLPNATRIAASSNAEGARIAAADSRFAAIAGERAAAQYLLHSVAQGIQDEAFNRTRFAVVCLPQTLAAPLASGRDCTSLVVSVTNQPGAVHDLLVPLKDHGVSMTRFESRPARSGQWEYYFFIDLQGHPSQANVAAALKELRKLCAFYKVLGTYPVPE
jgi:chorismate mutase / prephenate dehydratase